ncbi:hypothetical protein [Ruminococcus sp.]|uniref:hypothetical protein n=1 Tax=Ruminococcus sp. TaxID=41978 RepID=UPI003F125614
MEAIQYKCPNCGGELKFDAGKQLFGCEYCRSLFSEEEMQKVCKENEEATQSRSQEDIQQEQEFAEHTNLYECGSCGAQIVADDNTAASFCYYCHNPVILKGRLSGEYKPGKVLPFKITREQALNIFSNWCKKRWFLPAGFKEKQNLEKITGLYVPFWVADCTVHADMQAIGKKIKTWTSGDYRYTRTREYAVHRVADIGFEGIPADGSSKVEDLLMETIEPFDYKELKPFSMSYLSGFYADKYDVDKAQVFPRIRNRAVQGSDTLLRGSMKGYDSVSVTSSAMNVLRTDWQYLLLPVWFATFKFEDKVYEFAINGQTGKQAGTPPLSKGKLAAFCAGLGAVVALIVLLGGYLLG